MRMGSVISVELKLIAKMITTFENGHIIDTWYDRKTRNWITQLRDSNDYQVGDAIFSGNKKDATISHKDMIANTINLSSGG